MFSVVFIEEREGEGISSCQDYTIVANFRAVGKSNSLPLPHPVYSAFHSAIGAIIILLVLSLHKKNCKSYNHILWHIYMQLDLRAFPIFVFLVEWGYTLITHPV